MLPDDTGLDTVDNGMVMEYIWIKVQETRQLLDETWYQQWTSFLEYGVIKADVVKLYGTRMKKDMRDNWQHHCTTAHGYIWYKREMGGIINDACSLHKQPVLMDAFLSLVNHDVLQQGTLVMEHQHEIKYLENTYTFDDFHA